MKAIKETLLSEKENIDMTPNKIDLTSISNIVNELNFLMAPVVMSDVRKADALLKTKLKEYEQKLVSLKTIHKDTKDLDSTKVNLTKQLKVLALLSDLHGNYVVNDKLKQDSKILLSELSSFGGKRLDSQIQTLSRILK